MFMENVIADIFIFIIVAPFIVIFLAIPYAMCKRGGDTILRTKRAKELGAICSIDLRYVDGLPFKNKYKNKLCCAYALADSFVFDCNKVRFRIPYDRVCSAQCLRAENTSSQATGAAIGGALTGTVGGASLGFLLGSSVKYYLVIKYYAKDNAKANTNTNTNTNTRNFSQTFSYSNSNTQKNGDFADFGKFFGQNTSDIFNGPLIDSENVSKIFEELNARAETKTLQFAFINDMNRDKFMNVFHDSKIPENVSGDVTL